MCVGEFISPFFSHLTPIHTQSDKRKQFADMLDHLRDSDDKGVQVHIAASFWTRNKCDGGEAQNEDGEEKMEEDPAATAAAPGAEAAAASEAGAAADTSKEDQVMPEASATAPASVVVLPDFAASMLDLHAEWKPLTTAQACNAWLSDATQGNIRNMIQSVKGYACILMAAVYFKVSVYLFVCFLPFLLVSFPSRFFSFSRFVSFTFATHF